MEWHLINVGRPPLPYRHGNNTNPFLSFMEASNDQGNRYLYRQLFRSAPLGALTAIRFMIFGTYMLLYLKRLIALG